MANKNLIAFAAALASLTLAACVSDPLPPVDPNAQPLVGRWSQVFSFEGIRDEIAIDLRPDATIEVKVRRHSGSGIDEYGGAGKWRVEEGYFVAELAFPGPRNAVNHLIGRHRIIAVTEWQWVSDYRNGEQLTAWRYPK
jgi:hypothetical protein